MFEVGQYVVKANTGVCRVTGITTYSLSDDEEEKLYYNLEVIGDRKGTLFVPVDSDKSNMRKVMSEEQAESLLDRIPKISAVAVKSDRLREQEYKDALKSNEPELIVGMIKNLYRRSKEREACGKHTTAIDDRYSKMAEGVLFSEIELVLGKEKEEIRQFIAENIF